MLPSTNPEFIESEEEIKFDDEETPNDDFNFDEEFDFGDDFDKEFDFDNAFEDEEEFKIITENFKAKAGADYAASRGEYLSAIVMSKLLGADFVIEVDGMSPQKTASEIIKKIRTNV